MIQKPLAFSINFDSFNYNFDFPKNYKDQTFLSIFDRFLNFSTRFKFKYSIYIIGRDLENPEITARVKEWSQAGHEIGNHSYSHIQNLGAHSYSKIEYEILKSHEIILKCTSKEPRGFIAPGWAASKKIAKILIKNNYLYDTSIFPSLLLYPGIVKNAINHFSRPKEIMNIIRREDYLYPLLKPLHPYFADENYSMTTINNKKKLVVLPLPTLSRIRGSMWHTLWFIFGEQYCKKELKKYLDNYEYFYYLMHPADLADHRDIGGRKTTMERMNVDLREKMGYMQTVFGLIANSKRPIVTLEELALNFLKEKKLSSN